MSDSYNEFHEYEIQWTPDEIKWIIDGKVGRTRYRKDTWNATSNSWAFPQTPSRVQLSIWPGGLETNAKGTVDWAGGVIDWNSDEIKDYGYYFATFGEIKVECYKGGPPGTSKGVSYYYNDVAATNNTVVDSNKPTVLKSLLGTGTDMGKGDGTTTGGASSSSAVHGVPGGSANPPNVPGGSNSGSGSGSDSGSGSGSGSDSDSGGGSSSGGDTSGCDATKFSQNCGSQGNGSPSGNDGVRGVERTLGASALAGIIGIAALLFL